MSPEGLSEDGRLRGRPFSFLIVALAAVILLRAVPLARAYVEKLLALHSLPALAAATAAAISGYLVLTFSISRFPRATAAALGAAALALTVLSGNAAAAVIAAAILAATLLAGDLAWRVLVGREAGEGDLCSVFAAGVVTLGLAPLALGEIGMWNRGWLLAAAVLLLVARRRRAADLARLLVRAVRFPFGGAPRVLEASWLAAVAIFLAAAWAGALAPEFSWDGLTYHLPEARDAAAQGSVEPLFGLAPQTFLWHNEENYLSLGFLFGDERTAHLLHFAIGLAVFGAALSLARRIGASGSRPLVLLALAAFPTAVLQLHAVYADWPAAFLVIAAASEIAASRGEPRRALVAGFLFGGAVVTKIFALLAAPALLLLWLVRPGRRGRRLAAAAAGMLLALVPWMLWSQSRAGFFLAPYRSMSSLAASISGQPQVHPHPTAPARRAHSLAAFLRLPYDLTFHSHRFEENGDGYDGMLPLLLVPGAAALGIVPLGLFLAASLPVLVPWFRLDYPSVRYLIPLYPLYAVFAAHGITRGTRRFAGAAGAAAALAVTATALSFPVQLGSSGTEWKVAAGRMTREQALSLRVPSYPLWRHVRPEDRVLFAGEYDRFHCPARWLLRSGYFPVNAWGEDRELWRRGLRTMRVTHIVELAAPRLRSLLDSLPDTVELVERHGDASLYRVVPSS